MRKNQTPGIVNDLLNFREYENPLNQVWIKNKLDVNLKNGKIIYPERDSLYDFYGYKRKWFMGRVKKLKGNLADFEEARIIVFGKKEKIMIKYKGKTFENEFVYEDTFGKDIKELREAIKKLKPIDISKNKK